MILYLIIVFITVAITVIFNMLLAYFNIIHVNMYFPMLYSMLIVLALVAVDGICVCFVRFILPKKLFNPERKCFKVSSKEKDFLERWGVKKYKDRIPELGVLAGFKKDQVYDMNSPEYLYEFLRETCYAEVMHIISAVFSFVVIFMCYDYGWLMLSLATPLALCNVVLNILPINVQRYNRPRLEILYKRALRNKERLEATKE